MAYALKATRLCSKCRLSKPAALYATNTSRKCNDCKRAEARTCARCGQSRPLESYVRRGRVCAECRADGPPCTWRACFRCFEVKPARAFPWGDGSTSKFSEPKVRRRLHVCTTCKEKEREEREITAIRRRATWISADTERLVRRCRRCGEVKDLELGFNIARAGEGLTMEQRRGYRCKECQAKDGHERWLRHRKDAEWMEGERAKWREQARRYRELNPEKAKAAQLRWVQKIRSDPVRAAREREDNRIEYRLRRERNGKSVRNVAERIKDRTGRNHRLPAAPLAVAVDRLIAIEGAGNLYDDLPQDPRDTNGRRTEVVCERLGIPARTLFAWRVGERATVQFPLADRVLTRAGLNWWDVWNEDTTDADGLAVVEAVFEPEGAVA